ncbi:hypothetical protein LAUMK40_02577 [Mycobacterium kansasii]|jgi:hypothetical protein|nr:hypothetical protein LAUMK40_02577 [Mycobacterium kansasii]
MSETLDPVATELDHRQLAEQLLAQAKEQGVELVGPNGLLSQLTKNVLETALDAEMAEHLGYDKHDPAGRGSGNSRNGTRAKTVLTAIGPVEIKVPRDTNSSFEPQIVKKRQRRLTGIDEIVLSLTAQGSAPIFNCRQLISFQLPLTLVRRNRRPTYVRRRRHRDRNRLLPVGAHARDSHPYLVGELDGHRAQ